MDGAMVFNRWRQWYSTGGASVHPRNAPRVKKGCHPNHGYDFVNSWWICKIVSLLQRAVNLQRNQYLVTHHTLSMLLH